MKIFSKLALVLGFSLAFVACDDDDKFQPGAWDGSADSDTVYFADDEYSVSEILDPTDPTEKTFRLFRKNTEGESTVKFKVVENTDDVFEVSEATFADGEGETTFTVSFPDAEVDKTYRLTIQPEGSSSWDANTLLAYSILIERWNNLGVGLYVDDILTTFFGVGNIPEEVEILEKASKPGLYRVVYPYGEAYPYNEPGDWDDTKTYYLEIDATDPTAVWFDQQEQGLDWGYGNLTVWSLAGYYMANGKSLSEVKEDGCCGTLEDGIITFPAESLLIKLPNYSANFYTANVNGAFAVVLPDAYAAMQEEGEGEEVKALKAPGHIKVSHKLK